MQLMSMNRGWRYFPGIPAGATDPTFDDGTWEQVSVPHATRVVPWHGFDDRKLAGVSVYRRRFRLPDGLDGRVFLDFDGVMVTAAPVLNGTELGEHRGGFVPFSYEITEHVDRAGENVLAVVVDSTERPDVPPYGGKIDYLSIGGIYRDVAIRVVPQVFVADVFATPVRVLEPDPGVDVQVELDAGQPAGAGLVVEVSLRDGEQALATTSRAVRAGATGTVVEQLSLDDIGAVELWELDRPRLYDVTVRLRDGDRVQDERTVRVGFRTAEFTPRGFRLNGRPLTLRGVNRHQTYPFVGSAMPARVQRKDADLIRHELKCNVVRASHYPQSPYFLDRCDEIGLLVVEEIPGWQHIGDEAWKDLACRDVEAMVRRDRNHPSIVLWGTRINESKDDHDFYARTNRIAKELDGSRQTGGIRDFADSELLEDVFTVNDFDPSRLREPNHPRYLNTEFGGHTFPTKSYDTVDRVQEHLLRHAHVLNQLEGDERYAGGIAWCAFDYNTHAYSGSGDAVCYHGVADIFRIPKPVAALYRSQCDPAEDVVIEPAFTWCTGEIHYQVRQFSADMGLEPPWGGGPGQTVICSNCDELRLYVGDQMIAEIKPDRQRFGNLAHPPFVTDALARKWGMRWHDLRIDGYVGGRLVASRRVSASSADAGLDLAADDEVLVADGRDATRVVFRVTDEFGNTRRYATGAVALSVDGPGVLVGENPFALVGGVGAVWLRSTETPGPIRVRATHPTLPEQSVTVVSELAPAELL